MDFSIELHRKLIGSFGISDFEQTSSQVFSYQKEHNPVYRSYLDMVYEEHYFLSKFLPIEAFKNNLIKSGHWQPEQVFKSSSTTGAIPSSHAVKDLDFYHTNALRSFEDKYGPVEEYCVLALLPHYIERGHSSLVSMVDYFIKKSGYQESGFYLYDHQKLLEVLVSNLGKGKKVLLFGVTYALLDFAALSQKVKSFEGLTIIETGGMKGRGQEMTREDLHKALKNSYSGAIISSEYGMTELLSQAYLDEDGYFYGGKTMKVLISEINDPFKEEKMGKTGVINIVDLANFNTCSFIKTQDLGRMNSKGGFQVLGRMDHSEMRGCNLMVQDLK